MRTTKGLLDLLVDAGRFEASLRKAVRGKRRRPDVASLVFVADDWMERTRAELAAGIWRPEGFELLRIHDPKPRIIARAPAADRVVHAAVADVLSPVLLRPATDDTFACRVGYGTHRAVLRMVALAQQHPFVVHLDVKAYFPSIEPEQVLNLIDRRIHDSRFMALMAVILASGRGLYDAPAVREFVGLPMDWPAPGCGLPIGASTSQVLAAHLVLQDLDHWVKRTLRVPGYVRYVDDLFLFGPSRARLREVRREVADWLHTERRMRLKHPDAPVLSTAAGFEALGSRVDRSGVHPRPGRRWCRGAGPGSWFGRVLAAIG